MTLQTADFEGSFSGKQADILRVVAVVIMMLAAALWVSELMTTPPDSILLYFGIHIGFVITCSVSLVIRAFETKQHRFYWQVGLVLTLLLLTLSMPDSTIFFEFPEMNEIEQRIKPILICLAFFFAWNLVVHQLKSTEYELTKLHFRVMHSVGILALIVSFFSYNFDDSSRFTLNVILASLALLLCSFSLFVERKELKSVLASLLSANGVLFITLLLLGTNSVISPFPSLTNFHVLTWGLILLTLLSLLPTIMTSNPKDLADASAGENEDMQQQLAEQNLELQMTLRELQERNQELEKLNTLDALSGIHNRRHFDKRLLAELRRARRELTPLTLILFDIDHFKSINDNYGHLTGDEVIRTVAHTASEMLNRSADEAFRYGGEEFALILPNTEVEGGLMLAEKVREAIASASVAASSGTVQCTVSLGVAVTDASRVLTPAEFIEMADSALYKAKQSGRNQVILFSPEE